MRDLQCSLDGYPRTAPASSEEVALIGPAQRPSFDADEGAHREIGRFNPAPGRAPPNGPHAAGRLDGGPESHDPTAADTWVEEIPYADCLSQA